jgi:hypothetical protein
LTDFIGRPGLWRALSLDGSSRAVFACPKAAQLVPIGSWGIAEARAAELELFAWARDTARGRLRRDWQAPSPEEVESWLAARQLVARASGRVVKGEVECDAKSLRIFFPELARLSDELSSARRSWASALCLDAHSQWQLARFALVDDRVQAEVDLSGVPASMAPALFALALDALVVAVEWVLPALALVTDSSVASRTLDREPRWSVGESSSRGPGAPAPHLDSAAATAPVVVTGPG